MMGGKQKEKNNIICIFNSNIRQSCKRDDVPKTLSKNYQDSRPFPTTNLFIKIHHIDASPMGRGLKASMYYLF